MTVAELEETFRAQVEPLRRELTAHCYRMVGSAQDAEDLVQDTYLRAWRAFHGFENRSSVRTWMYKIATNTCLTALHTKQRRPLPTGLGGPKSNPAAALDERPEIPWLEPMPDALLWSEPSPDPADDVVTRDSVRLAFIAALQHLTAQQRAVIILADVLAWRAREVAEALDLSVAAVNSSLQRARAHLARRQPSGSAKLPDDDQRARELLDNYVHAFEEYDVSKIVELLRQDVVWEMPPFTGWWSGPEDVGALISQQCPAKQAGDFKTLRTSANDQPTIAFYLREADGVHRAFQLQQLTITATGVSHVAVYFDLSLFDLFDLPKELA